MSARRREPPQPVPDPAQPNPSTGGELTSIRQSLPGDWAEQIDLFAIIKLDSGGIVRGWNLGAERMKGYTGEQIIGSHFSVFYRPEDRRRGLPDQLLAAAQRDGHVEDTGWRVRSDGEQFWARVTISAIHSDEGQLLGFVKVVQDMTAQRRAEDERVTAQRTFAHDLLSPLAALRGHLDLLAEELPADNRSLGLATTASDHLIAMAQSLLSAATSSPGRARRRAPLDLIARGAVALVLPGEAAARVTYGEMAAVPVVVDVLALRRAIANVLENAAKYSDDQILVQVSDGEDDAAVSVQDRGRGIHPDDVQAVMQEGGRGRYADERDGGSGIGLGLASVRMIMDDHGGTLRIDSVPGEGTTVRLTLPRAES